MTIFLLRLLSAVSAGGGRRLGNGHQVLQKLRPLAAQGAAREVAAAELPAQTSSYSLGFEVQEGFVGTPQQGLPNCPVQGRAILAQLRGHSQGLEELSGACAALPAGAVHGQAQGGRGELLPQSCLGPCGSLLLLLHHLVGALQKHVDLELQVHQLPHGVAHRSAEPRQGREEPEGAVHGAQDAHDACSARPGHGRQEENPSQQPGPRAEHGVLGVQVGGQVAKGLEHRVEACHGHGVQQQRHEAGQAVLQVELEERPHDPGHEGPEQVYQADAFRQARTLEGRGVLVTPRTCLA
mmetsp:Transcript_126878/g.370999  ORF Transcript_126878/g.370999 Transcript_126878/m.370999 type:complete len:295 (+) Transcript_126878:253-1137(+)